MTFTAKRKISCERLADAASSLRQRKNNEKTKICSICLSGTFLDS